MSCIHCVDEETETAKVTQLPKKAEIEEEIVLTHIQ